MPSVTERLRIFSFNISSFKLKQSYAADRYYGGQHSFRSKLPTDAPRSSAIPNVVNEEQDLLGPKTAFLPPQGPDLTLVSHRVTVIGVKGRKSTWLGWGSVMPQDSSFLITLESHDGNDPIFLLPAHSLP